MLISVEFVAGAADVKIMSDEMMVQLAEVEVVLEEGERLTKMGKRLRAAEERTKERNRILTRAGQRLARVDAVNGLRGIRVGAKRQATEATEATGQKKQRVQIHEYECHHCGQPLKDGAPDKLCLPCGKYRPKGETVNKLYTLLSVHTEL